jgi:hypothetical protein
MNTKACPAREPWVGFSFTRAVTDTTRTKRLFGKSSVSMGCFNCPRCKPYRSGTLKFEMCALGHLLLIRPYEVFNAQRSCRSAVEGPDMGLSRNPSCRTLRAPTYEMTCLTHFKPQRAGSISWILDHGMGH